MRRITERGLVPARPRYDGDGDGTITVELDKLFENSQIKERLDAAVAEATGGLRTNRDSILGEKRELREELDAIKKQWEGLDSETVNALMSRIANDDEAKLIAEGKVDEVIARRTDAMRKDAETKVTAALKRVAELEESITSKDGKIAELVIDSAVQEAAAAAGVQGTSIADIVLRARQTFALDDEHRPVARDTAGALLMGKNGRDPLTPSEWLDGMKERAPHWWPPSKGAGAPGGDERLSDGADIEKLTPRQKLAHGMGGGAGA